MFVERSSISNHQLPESHFVTEVIYSSLTPQIDSLSNTPVVTHSLKHYMNDLHSTGELPIIFEQHKTTESTRRPYFSVAFAPKDDAKLPESSFYIDGDYGIAIGVKQKRKDPFVWTAVASFVPHPYDEKAPLITQLQSRWFWEEEKSREGHVLLDNYRWEFALVNLIALWSLRAGLKTLYIQSSEDNTFTHMLGKNQAKMRYDVTAKRLGFTKEDSGKSFKLSLT